MGYPCLIPNWALNADVSVALASEGVNEDGETVPDVAYVGKCNLQLKAGQKLDSKKQQVRTQGKAYFQGDICPNIKDITDGVLLHNGTKYTVNGGSKALNFDGSVNYTELELI